MLQITQIACVNTSNTYGAKIRELRIEKGLSQQQLATKTGLTRQQIANYETRRMPPLPVFVQIHKAFGIEILKN